MRRSTLAVLGSLGLALAQSFAPDELQSRTAPYTPPPLTLRTQVDLVEVPVVVRDAQGRAVAGLKRDDFTLFDAGKKQAITAFTAQEFSSAAGGAAGEPPARFLALLFDDLHTGAADLQAAKTAARQFVQTSLAPADRVVVASASHSENGGFTSDVPALLSQIDQVTSRALRDNGGCIRLETPEAYLLANRADSALLQQKLAECMACQHRPCRENEIVSLAVTTWERALSATKSTLGVLGNLVSGMAKLPGQRMVLLTSSEVLTGNLEPDFDRLMDQARHTGIVISTLDARRLFLTYNPRDVLRQDARGDGLSALAFGTGGAFYHNNNDLLEGFRQSGMLPETLYILGFSPANVIANGHFHDLKVQLAAGKQYSVQARLGYTAPMPKAPEPASAAAIDSEVMARDLLTDLPVSFTWEEWTGSTNVTAVIHLDIGQLHFKSVKNRRTQKLKIVAAVLDRNGNFVTGKQSEFDLNLSPATFERLSKTSFTASLTLKVPPGHYFARAVAQDALEGKLATAVRAVEVQ